jgi:DNA-binding NarL/FixJ family response regulator
MKNVQVQTSRARRVVLLDSHDIFRMGVRSALSERAELDVVGETGDVDEGLALVARARPHVLVVGIREHELDLLEMLPRLQAQYPPTRMLVLSRSDEDQVLTAAMRGGASGYLVKDVAVSQLVSAVHSIAGGHNLIESGPARRMAERTTQASAPGADDPLAGLTPQERKILALIGEGLTNRQIAERLYEKKSAPAHHRH